MNLITSIRSFAERTFELTGIERGDFCLDGRVYRINYENPESLEILKIAPLKSIKPHFVYAKHISRDDVNIIAIYDKLTNNIVLEIGSRFISETWSRHYYVNLEGLAINSNYGLYMNVIRKKKFNRLNNFC